MKRQITRVVIENYRSIRHCDVRLGPLTLLVGPNGSGKSNFLDALRFVADSLHAPFDQVLGARSGFVTLAYREPTGAFTPRFTITLEMALGDLTANYSLACEWEAIHQISVTESCALSSGPEFEVRDGRVFKSTVAGPALTGDRPALVAFGGHEDFSPVFRMLSEMTFYSPDPAVMREPRRPGVPDVLTTNGDNLVNVIRVSKSQSPGVLNRIRDYLAAIVPNFRGLYVRDYESVVTVIQFVIAGDANRAEQLFELTQMSDGTLRSLALLVALFQPSLPLRAVSLVGLEEPENNLHPAAAGILVDAMLEASVDVQVIATTHSADLLDHPELPLDAILTVEMEKGESIIAPLGETTREIVRRKLYTPGELLRNRQLWPESGA